jgi:exoribonuclease R
MLPNGVLDAFTLGCGRDCPAVSLYLTVTPEFEISAHETLLEVVPVVANLRHHDLEPLFNEQSIAEGLSDFAFRDELMTLWQLANACEGRRGKASAMQGQHDYNFRIDGDLGDAEACRVDISARKRGSPLDKLVAELMIVANSTWGGLLANKGGRRHLSGTDRRQGAHEHFAAGTRRPGGQAVCLVVVAAAPLCGPAQPVAVDRLPERSDASLRRAL